MANNANNNATSLLNSPHDWSIIHVRSTSNKTLTCFAGLYLHWLAESPTTSRGSGPNLEDVARAGLQTWHFSAGVLWLQRSINLLLVILWKWANKSMSGYVQIKLPFKVIKSINIDNNGPFTPGSDTIIVLRPRLEDWTD